MDITSPWTRGRADTTSRVELSGAKNSALTAPGYYCTNLTLCNKQNVNARFGRARLQAPLMPGRLIEPLVGQITTWSTADHRVEKHDGIRA
jgi:hypothetical protein